MLHSENLKDSSDEEMEKAVRSVIVYKASETMSIAAVLLDRWFLFILKSLKYIFLVIFIFIFIFTELKRYSCTILPAKNLSSNGKRSRL
jgi:hypothetical protein